MSRGTWTIILGRDGDSVVFVDVGGKTFTTSSALLTEIEAIRDVLDQAAKYIAERGGLGCARW
jgi:hypothetical protein